ncbi:MAG: hypothetical protein ACLQIH_17240 [Myxococcaceae bacterium]
MPAHQCGLYGQVVFGRSHWDDVQKVSTGTDWRCTVCAETWFTPCTPGELKKRLARAAKVADPLYTFSAEAVRWADDES